MAAKPSFSNNTTNNQIVEGHNLGRGRPPGARNRTTRILKEAIILAAESIGEDGQGRDGLVGFFRNAAKEELPAYLSLMGKLLPLQVSEIPVAPLRIVDESLTLEERQRRFAEDLKLMREGHMPSRLVQLIDEKAAEKVKQLQEQGDWGMD